jgi:DNA polymerase-3 subunit delta'
MVMSMPRTRRHHTTRGGRAAPGVAANLGSVLPGTESHPHARAVLAAALPPAGSPSHAYLFHGPAGAGKARAARAFAAALLADGDPDPGGVALRVDHGVHPDLTWVTPSGAAEMLVGDIDEAVVAAATRTPFESRRRVFVIERVETMNDQAANKMLKTLEEPPSFAHLILLTSRPSQVLPTITSRCQLVRFDTPAVADIALQLEREGVDTASAQACARLALGDAARAAMLAQGGGAALRERSEAFARATLSGDLGDRPWLALLEQAKQLGEEAGGDVARRVEEELELLPAKEHRRVRKDAEDTTRRAQRRARTGALDHALQLVGLWYRDVACIVDGAPELVHATDREAALGEDAARLAVSHGLRRAVELVDESRAALVMLNATEELLLETLASHIERLLTPQKR